MPVLKVRWLERILSHLCPELQLRESTVREHVSAVDGYHDLPYVEEPPVNRIDNLSALEQTIESSDFVAGATQLTAAYVGKLKIPFKTRCVKRFWWMLWLRLYSMVIYVAIGLLVFIGIRLTSKDASRYKLRTVLMRWPLAWIKVYGVLKDQ